MKRSTCALSLCLLLVARTASAQAIPSDRLDAATRLVGTIEAQTLVAQAATLPEFDEAECLDNATNQPGGVDCGRLKREFEATAALGRVKRPQVLAALREAMRTGYARRFTVEELDSITRFYNTTVGQKLLRERPALEGEFRAAQNRAFAEIVFGTPSGEGTNVTKVMPR